MSKIFWIILIGILIALVTALGDGMVKKATLFKNFSGWLWLLGGAAIYAITALGWFYVLQKMKLSSAVVVYTVSLVLFVVLISIFYFKESINIIETIGIILAIVSIVILSRFA